MKASFTIVGRISKKPELSSSKDGTKTFARLSVEVVDGDKKVYFNLTLWDKMAKEFADDFSDKEMIELSGNMYQKPIEKKDGYKEYVPVLNVQKMKKVKADSKKSDKADKKETSSEFDESQNSEDISKDFDSIPLDESENK